MKFFGKAYEKAKAFGSAVKNSPPVKNLGESFERDPVRATAQSAGIVAGAVVIGLGAAEMSKGRDLLTPEGSSYTQAEPEIPGKKVEVKLAPTAEESVTPVSLKEPKGE